MALLFITHDLNLVRRFTHRVGVMERGRLVESGDTAEVFGNPQHAYTKKLLASRPQRVLQPVREDAPLLLRGEAVRVSFDFAEGWFGKRQFIAVRNATVELRRGETLGIVGESGSGKTTLGMALLALQAISGGTVRMGSERIDNANRQQLRAMRRRMQVVFQDPFASLSPRRTIGQIVCEGLDLHRPELSRAERDTLVLQMLDEVGPVSYTHLLGVPATIPSLGELLKIGKENLDAWWIIFSTFSLLVMTMLLLTFIGDAVRDAFDTRKS